MYEINDKVKLTIADKDKCIVVSRNYVEEEYLYAVIKMNEYNRMMENNHYKPRVYNVRADDLTYTIEFLRKLKIKKLIGNV